MVESVYESGPLKVVVAACKREKSARARYPFCEAEAACTESAPLTLVKGEAMLEITVPPSEKSLKRIPVKVEVAVVVQRFPVHHASARRCQATVVSR